MDPENLLLIFIKNPIAGNVKTRLAKDVGNEKALEYYKKVLKITREESTKIKATKWLCYGDFINTEDDWSEIIFEKKLQEPGDLGERMLAFFESGFEKGFKRIVIIGSDCPELESSNLEEAFNILEDSDAVIGPANDGGYYLLGLSKNVNLFQNKKWSTESVFEDTLNDFKREKLSFGIMKEKVDLDTIEDLKKFPNL
jgi:hypothetical protein